MTVAVSLRNGEDFVLARVALLALDVAVGGFGGAVLVDQEFDGAVRIVGVAVAACGAAENGVAERVAAAVPVW